MFDLDNSDIRLQVYPLQKDGQFTQEDADINRELVNPLIYPWLYNLEKDDESCLVLDGDRSQLVDASIISPPSNTGHNTAWEGDGNPEKHNIRASFAEHGYKLHYPPLALFQDDRISNGNIILIDRRTTHSILVGGYINEKSVGDSYNYKKVIADKFKVKDGNNPRTGKPWTVEEIEDEISVFGQAVNYKGQDPKGKINQNSFVKDFVRIYQNYLKSGKYSHLFDKDVDTKGETVFVPKIDVVLKRLNRVMGNSGSATPEREKLAYRIINSFYPSDKFLSDFINTIINTSDININETLIVLGIGSINIRSNFNNFIAKLKTTFNKVTYLDDNNNIQINYDQITFEEQLTTLLIPTSGVEITFEEWIEYFNTELLVEGGGQSGGQEGETKILEEYVADIVYNIISPNLEVNMYWLERYRTN